MFKSKLDLFGKDVGDKGFVVGPILALHLHQQLVIHADKLLVQLLPALALHFHSFSITWIFLIYHFFLQFDFLSALLWWQV